MQNTLICGDPIFNDSKSFLQQRTNKRYKYSLPWSVVDSSDPPGSFFSGAPTPPTLLSYQRIQIPFIPCSIHHLASYWTSLDHDWQPNLVADWLITPGLSLSKLLELSRGATPILDFELPGWGFPTWWQYWTLTSLFGFELWTGCLELWFFTWVATWTAWSFSSSRELPCWSSMSMLVLTLDLALIRCTSCSSGIDVCERNPP